MGIVISTHLPPPVVIESTEVLKCVTTCYAGPEPYTFRRRIPQRATTAA
jgi:hypothetical protein